MTKDCSNPGDSGNLIRRDGPPLPPLPHCPSPLENVGHLTYCTHCGAPQVVLSEEILTQAAEQQAMQAAEAAADTPLANDPAAPHWSSLIRLAAGFSVVFAFFALLLPPLAVVLPALVLAFYSSRHAKTLLSPALGLRVGLLCGVFLSAILAIFQTCAMLALRYITHDMSVFDASVNATLARTQAQMAAQSGPQAAALLGTYAAIPEFRVGGFFFGMSIFMAIFLAVCLFGGAFAGYLGARRQARAA